jgi:hypothetical protein
MTMSEGCYEVIVFTSQVSPSDRSAPFSPFYPVCFPSLRIIFPDHVSDALVGNHCILSFGLVCDVPANEYYFSSIPFRQMQ